MNSVCIIKNTMTALERGNKKVSKTWLRLLLLFQLKGQRNQVTCHQLSSCTQWSFLINTERVQPIRRLKIFTQSRKTCLNGGPCRAQANHRYFKLLLPLPVFSATTGLSLDAWTWLCYMHRLISQCWKLLEFCSFAHQTVVDALSFSNISCSVLHFYYTLFIAGEAGAGRGHLHVGSHFSNAEGYRGENNGAEVSSQRLGAVLPLHSTVIDKSYT